MDGDCGFSSDGSWQFHLYSGLQPAIVSYLFDCHLCAGHRSRLFASCRQSLRDGYWPDATASSRLNLTQALNSIATMIAPWLISVAIFKGLSFPADATIAAQRVPMPFITMGLIVLLVAVIIFTIKLPVIHSEKSEKKSILNRPHVVLGALAIFTYVGAEVGNAGLIVNYLKNSLGMLPEQASTYAAIHWGCHGRPFLRLIYVQ